MVVVAEVPQRWWLNTTNMYTSFYLSPHGINKQPPVGGQNKDFCYYIQGNILLIPMAPSG